jgi:DNA-binding XRE family transcriptional regulator
LYHVCVEFVNIVCHVFAKFFGSVIVHRMEVDGVKLRELRLDAGLSQQELADRAGLTREAVSMMETGKRNPYPRTMRKLAGALGVTVAEIRGRD